VHILCGFFCITRFTHDKYKTQQMQPEQQYLFYYLCHTIFNFHFKMRHATTTDFIQVSPVGSICFQNTWQICGIKFY